MKIQIERIDGNYFSLTCLTDEATILESIYRAMCLCERRGEVLQLVNALPEFKGIFFGDLDDDVKWIFSLRFGAGKNDFIIRFPWELLDYESSKLNLSEKFTINMTENSDIESCRAITETVIDLFWQEYCSSLSSEGIFISQEVRNFGSEKSTSIVGRYEQVGKIFRMDIENKSPFAAWMEAERKFAEQRGVN